MSRFLPKSLFGQTLLILLAGLIISHAFGSWIYTADREQAVRAVGGFAAESLSLEIMVSLQPELVVADDEIHLPVIAALERLNIPVMSLGADTLSALYGDIELLGKMTGHSEQAQRLAGQLRERVEAVRRAASRIPPDERVTVFYQIWDAPLTTAGPASFIGEMIECCGGVNIVTDSAARYPQFSEETLLARDPAVILAPTQHASALSFEYFEEKPGWKGLRAVKNHRIYLIDGDNVSRCGPRLIDALEAMARVLYPDHAPDRALRGVPAGNVETQEPAR